jgi:hypothetical protein
MPPQLPVEVAQAIVEHCTGLYELKEVALVSPSFRLAVSKHLHRDVLITSSTSARAFLNKLETSPSSANEAQSLTVGKGRTTRMEKVGRGRKAVEQQVEDSVSEEDFVKLCEKLRRATAVHLEEPNFSTLRRRQVGCLSHLSLTTLSIHGRSDSPFNASTVGQLLLTLSKLKHLSLRNIHFFPGALDSLAVPSNGFSSFSLTSSPGVSSKQFYWFLHSTINAESLTSLSFDIPLNFRPSRLYPVRWAPVRTTEIHCTSEQAGALENLPRHCPSLRRYTFSSSRQLDPQRLLSACEAFDTVAELFDASAVGNGLSPLRLAAVLAFEDESRFRSIRRISFIKSRRKEDGMRLLRAVCRIRGIEVGYQDRMPRH